jgi:hypothetical protein
MRAEGLRCVPDGHIVHFYDHDEELVRAVGAYLVDGLRTGDVVVIAATPSHRVAFEAFLEQSGVDLLEAQEAGRWTPLDAGETLSLFMVDGAPDPEAFAAVIGDRIGRALAPGRPVRVYGEMVALLWAEGNCSGAISLEALWNELGDRQQFALYCAYPVSAMADASVLRAAKDVCDHHTSVVSPASYVCEEYPDVSPDGQGERTRFFLPVPLAARAVRRFVADSLRGWCHDSLIHDAELVVSELASNALLHASSPFRVTVSCEESAVKLAIHDASVVVPTHSKLGPLASGGRGVGIVAALSRRWGTDELTDGKVVWAELDVPLD